MEFQWRALDARVIQMGEKIEVSRAGPLRGNWEKRRRNAEGKGRGWEKGDEEARKRKGAKDIGKHCTLSSFPPFSTVFAKDYSIIQIL